MIDKKVSVVLAVVASFSLIVIFVGSQSGLTSSEPDKNPGCLDFDYVKAVKSDTPMPAYFPDGYEYKCGYATSEQSYLVFWDKPVDTDTYQIDLSMEAYVSPGSIMLRSDRSDLDPAVGVKQDLEEIAQNPNIAPVEITINGMKGWAYEADEKGGIDTTVFEGEQPETIVESFPIPAKLRLYDNGKMIQLEGFVELDELVKMANSLP